MDGAPNAGGRSPPARPRDRELDQIAIEPIETMQLCCRTVTDRGRGFQRPNAGLQALQPSVGRTGDTIDTLRNPLNDAPAREMAESHPVRLWKLRGAHEPVLVGRQAADVIDEFVDGHLPVKGMEPNEREITRVVLALTSETPCRDCVPTRHKSATWRPKSDRSGASGSERCGAGGERRNAEAITQ